ncbi:hypothetical protein B0H19DRAFT_1245876 [Mycena capillaripes]|nr:hypothetical protein B0H19DRAFT_1245876 [Mycena capillaripes]
MDDSAGFAQPYPPYSFDIDMMKVSPLVPWQPDIAAHPFSPFPFSFSLSLPSPPFPLSPFSLKTKQRSMDAAGGPDSKKARWSPTSAAAQAQAQAQQQAQQQGGSPRDPYANYGYGYGAGPAQVGSGPQIYATPQLSINTQTTAHHPHGQLSPNTLASFQAQQQAQQQQAQAQAQAQAQQAQSPVQGPGSPYAQFNPYNMLAMGSFPYPQQQNFQVQRRLLPQRLPTLNIPAAQAVYAPPPSAASSLPAAAPPKQAPSPPPAAPSTSATSPLRLRRRAPQPRALRPPRIHPRPPRKSCVFLSFLDAPTASAFFADASLRKLTLHSQELKVGWGKPSPVPAQEGMTEEMLRDELGRFGLIDQVKIVRDKNIGFVHFLSIGVATKVVNTLPTDPAWAGKRVNYGKDRCAYVPKSQQAAAHQAQAAAAQSLMGMGMGSYGMSPIGGMGAFASPIATSQSTPFGGNNTNNANANNGNGNGGNGNGNYANSPASAHPSGGGVNPFTGSGANGNPQTPASANAQQASPNTGYAPYTPAPFSPDALSAMMGMGMFGGMNGMGMGGMMSPMSPGGMGMLGGLQGLGMAGGNRTVYLGNIHPETSTEDLCNAIRGGVLQSVRYMADKHIAFITFIDPAAAFTFFQVSSYQGLTLNNRRLKIGWGKNSGPLPPTLALAVHAGATRNVYIGNVEDFEVFSEERLKADFGEFGDIELVNFLKEKNCAFVNFTNISNAIKAIDAIKNRPEYANLRIAHGKDRCANPPRSGPQGSGARRSASGNGPASAEPVSAIEPDGEMDFDVEAVQAEAESADAAAEGAVKHEQQEGMAVEGAAASS